MRTFPQSKRMEHLAQSDIRRMTLECERLGGINLGQGVCDLPTIPELKASLTQAVEANRAAYSRYDGVAPLRSAIAARLQQGGALYNPEGEIVVSVGATGAFAMTMMALLNPGDEVLLPEPFYGYHWNTIVALGGVPVPVALSEPGFDLDLGALSSAVTSKTKVVVVCSPANPSGKVWSTDELDGLIGFLGRHNLTAVTDEIYQDILYDGSKHISLASRPGGRERCVTVSGYSKTFSITGWRIGYAAAPEPLAASIGVLNDLFYVCAPTPLQFAVAGALGAVGNTYYKQLKQEYQEKRDRLVEVCANWAGSPGFLREPTTSWWSRPWVEQAQPWISRMRFCGMPA